MWVQLTRTDDSDPIGESVVLDPESSTVLERQVTADTYRFTGAVDDPNPALERSVQWEITDCSTTGIVTLAAGVDGAELLVDTASCDGS